MIILSFIGSVSAFICMYAVYSLRLEDHKDGNWYPDFNLPITPHYQATYFTHSPIGIEHLSHFPEPFESWLWRAAIYGSFTRKILQVTVLLIFFNFFIDSLLFFDNALFEGPLINLNITEIALEKIFFLKIIILIFVLVFTNHFAYFQYRWNESNVQRAIKRQRHSNDLVAIICLASSIAYFALLLVAFELMPAKMLAFWTILIGFLLLSWLCWYFLRIYA